MRMFRFLWQTRSSPLRWLHCRKNPLPRLRQQVSFPSIFRSEAIIKTSIAASTSSSTPVTLASVSSVNSINGVASSSSGLPSPTTSPTKSSSTKSTSLSGGAIAGRVIGAVVVLAIVGTTLYCLGRRLSKKGRKDNSTMASGEPKLGDTFKRVPRHGSYGEAELVGSDVPELQGQPRHELYS